MRLAKPAVDVGLSTNRPDAHLTFWRDQVGLALDAHLPIGPHQIQHRFHAGGSIVKVNGFAEPLPDGPRAGYREVLIAREMASIPTQLVDPDGSALTIVPPGFEGIGQIGIRIAVRDLAAHRRFYTQCLGLPEEGVGRFRAGETLLILEEDPQANPDAAQPSVGWRYITFQIFKADEAHSHALVHGAREARPPTTLRDVARFSIIRDPDGNAIELSQRASIVGNLD
ncbi:VOC family protein [Sphingobium tyrosinilyticum]|uniref:VOC family protein n=1 Tax=Sphingobium tyrosinilyticum TaxID=2715436 RepID=A0ABV9F4J1_9SPHN